MACFAPSPTSLCSAIPPVCGCALLLFVTRNSARASRRRLLFPRLLSPAVGLPLVLAASSHPRASRPTPPSVCCSGRHWSTDCGMDHLPRFHRRKRDVAPPALITSNLSGKTTPPPGDLQPMSPFRPLQKLSPFKVFHRSSGKRARDSRPDSAPLPPAVASVPARDSSEGRAGSPASMSMQTDAAAGEGQKPARPPKMPAFLNQTERGGFPLRRLSLCRFVPVQYADRAGTLQKSRASSRSWSGASGHASCKR